ncbi:MAG: hypothetical protein ABSH53_17425 [Holophaga sp.]
MTEILLRLLGAGGEVAHLESILAQYHRDAGDFRRIPADLLIGGATVLMARHGLGSSQGLHLAAVVHLSRRLRDLAPALPGSPILFVCINDRLRAAAQAEGLAVLELG